MPYNAKSSCKVILELGIKITGTIFGTSCPEILLVQPFLRTRKSKHHLQLQIGDEITILVEKLSFYTYFIHFWVNRLTTVMKIKFNKVQVTEKEK